MASNHAKAEKRSSADVEEFSRKKAKKTTTEVDAAADRVNPYLAHMHDDDDQANGYGPLAGMRRHKTTAAEASKAEDAAINPFTGRSHSQQYFRILETRRDLPVHKQR